MYMFLATVQHSILLLSRASTSYKEKTFYLLLLGLVSRTELLNRYNIFIIIALNKIEILHQIHIPFADYVCK